MSRARSRIRPQAVRLDSPAPSAPAAARPRAVAGARPPAPAVPLALALAALLPLALTAGCGGAREHDAPAARQVAARTVVVAARQVPLLASAPGSLEAAQHAEVSTRMMGWVRRVHVREGDTVRAGAPLVTIDDGDLRAKRAQVEAQIAEARAVLDNAEKNAARFEKLYAEKAVSRQRLDDVLTGRDRARAGLEAATAGLAEVQTHLRYLDITAPFAGLVARKTVQPGDMANPGQPLVVLEQTQQMKVVARLGEKDIGAVAAGDTVTVEVTALADASWRVPIARVIPAAAAGSRTFDIETYLPNADGRLRSGMFARVLVPVGRRAAVTAPREAIVERGQLRGAFVLASDGTARLRWLRLGRPVDGGDVEVLAGLADGETVAYAADAPLAEGDRVVSK